MSLELAAQHLASRGRKGDSMLVHMAPEEVSGLQALARAAGGTLTLNPDTGLPEANFLKRMLPMIIGAGITAATGGAAAPWMVGLGMGGFETLRTGSLEKGLMAGLGAYGGAGVAGGLLGAGAGAAQQAAIAGAGEGASQAAMNQAAAEATKQAIASPLSTMGAGIQGLGTEAGRSAALSSMGGGMGAAKYGLAALSPMMQTKTPMPIQGSGPNPYNFGFDWERPEEPSYDSREALQLRGRLRPIEGMAQGGPIEAMSYQNRMDTMMANGGQMFAEGGKTEDPAKGMTGASADAFRYLMGQSSASPATLAAQQFAERAPAPASVAAAPVATGGGGFMSRGLFGRSSASQTPNYGFDPATGQFTVFQTPEPEVVPTTVNPQEVFYGYAQGGIASLAQGGQSHLGDYSDGGRLLKGPGDGVSDSIPATIADKRPARLADGEFVVPARIVSELGNGSTEAGARKLYAMMDRVQKARGKTTGKNRVAVNSRAEKLLPA
jgi:hypothetical protein